MKWFTATAITRTSSPASCGRRTTWRRRRRRGRSGGRLVPAAKIALVYRVGWQCSLDRFIALVAEAVTVASLRFNRAVRPPHFFYREGVVGTRRHATAQLAT